MLLAINKDLAGTLSSPLQYYEAPSTEVRTLNGPFQYRYIKIHPHGRLNFDLPCQEA